MGVSVGEALALGVPVAVLSNYENDAPTVAELATTGAVADLGRHDAVDQYTLVRALAALLRAGHAGDDARARPPAWSTGRAPPARPSTSRRLVSRRRTRPC